MKKFLVLIISSFFIFAGSSAVLAQTIDFDELAAGSYANLTYADVVITDLNGGNINVLASGGGGTGYTSPVNNIAARSWSVGDGLLFTFTAFASNVSLTGGDGGGDTDRWSMEAFDASWNSIGFADTGAFKGADPVNPIPGSTYVDYRTLSLNISGIKYMKVTQLLWGDGFDDLKFNEGSPVPEPATMLLFGLGLLGLAGASRRKK